MIQFVDAPSYGVAAVLSHRMRMVKRDQLWLSQKHLCQPNEITLKSKHLQ